MTTQTAGTIIAQSAGAYFTPTELLDLIIAESQAATCQSCGGPALWRNGSYGDCEACRRYAEVEAADAWDWDPSRG